jgi:hypothetical protein
MDNSTTTINVTTLPVTADVAEEEKEEGEEEVVAITGTAVPPTRHTLQLRQQQRIQPPPMPSARMLARREQQDVAFEDLYSSDRRKSDRKISAHASYDDARPSRAATNGPNPKFAVGLDTRELCLVQSTRTPSRNGLI